MRNLHINSPLCISIFVSALFFQSCKTTEYYDPVVFKQEEIKMMTVLDENGRTVPVAAGKIRDCSTMKAVGVKECAWITCKEDKTQETGLRCEYFVPKTFSQIGDAKKATSALLSSSKDVTTQSQIESLVTSFDQGKTSQLQDFCRKDTVVCYMNARPYPKDKMSSKAELSTLLHKQSGELKNGDSFEISVFKN